MSALKQVIDDGLCIGCGFCRSLMPSDAPPMQLTDAGYLVPPDPDRWLTTDRLALAESACPAIHGAEVSSVSGSSSLIDPTATHDRMWGSFISVATGHALDPAIRHSGSSGGAITALANWLKDSGRADHVLVTTYDAQRPVETNSEFTADPATIMKAAGSKYSPASPLAALDQARALAGSIAIVARPCDISTIRRAMAHDNALRERVAVLISFFCAGTPSLEGNRTLLAKLGIADPDTLVEFRHRGEGWPGTTRAVTTDGTAAECTYKESWGGVLSRHLHPRCKICPDGIGELADIVAADAWYGDESGYPMFSETDGRSLVIARTRLGQGLLETALAAGVLAVEALPVREIDKMQPGQVRRRRHLRTRVATLKLAGRRLPSYDKSALRGYEGRIGMAERLTIALGTIKRMLRTAL